MRTKVLTFLVLGKIVVLSLILLRWDLEPLTTESVLAETRGPVHAEPEPEPGMKGDTQAEERTLLSAIRQKEEDLRWKEEELKKEKERLEIIKTEIDKKISELEELHREIQKALKRIDEFNSEKIRHIVKIYESMSPEDAARRLERLSDDLAVMILKSMKEKKAGKILGLVNVEKSVKLSHLMKEEIR